MELELTDFNLPAAVDSALTLLCERAGRRSRSMLFVPMLFVRDGAEEAVCLLVKPCGEEQSVRVAG